MLEYLNAFASVKFLTDEEKLSPLVSRLFDELKTPRSLREDLCTSAQSIKLNFTQNVSRHAESHAVQQRRYVT